ncbi:hypothetical protein [Algoriphagus persicinus]|uniref:hypothetical protein n=1 Tax=Algoriphagus persicinus TaxID=3108754 RepID=UPI002B36B38A|nr:hypothetical protein [Algoriphagus sp. E1-3-M2]MEB2787324.1 hypothetical protein [Algoriphagus sp. E1-3-M2]
MSKLYIFAIGGTGSRVLKSLVMLMAAGAKLKNHNQVVPIIIDPDSGNGDLNRTKDILNNYQHIRSKISNPENFFFQDITTTNNLTSITPRFQDKDFEFKLERVHQEKFKDYIHYSTMDKPDADIVDLLFSRENLDANLNIGFKGNPNMGSIVLNQFTDSEAFQRFGQSFNQDDSIFIINSIFGGTGAAGYPLLLKLLRSGSARIQNKEIIKESVIGAITYLPYFKLKDGEIKSQSFLGKAKAALDYYNRTIINGKQINAQYFLGDQENNTTYDNHVGSKEQKNDSHFLELAGALSIFDFDRNKASMDSNDSHVYEFGVENFVNSLDTKNLNEVDRNLIFQPLNEFSLFANYCKSGLQKAVGVSRWTIKNFWTKNRGITKDYFDSAEFKNEIQKFTQLYLEWLQELGGNKPGFLPQLINKTSSSDIFKLLDISNCEEISNIPLPRTEKDIHSELIKLFEKSTSIVSHKL